MLWLEQNQIIGKAASQHFISDPTNPTFPYMFQPWAVAYLKSHEELYKEIKDAAKKVEAEIKKNTQTFGYPF